MTSNRPVRRLRLTLCVLALLLMAGAAAATPVLNGTWQLDEEASDDVAEAGRAYAAALNEARRAAKGKQFDDNKPTSNNRFQAQADAALEMIREDARSDDWYADPDVVAIADARSIKIYVSRRIAILYDGEHRRLLTINPSGRAFSVRGTEITDDDFGRSLSYIEDQAMVIETTLHVGGKLVERYELDGGEDRLRMTIGYRQRASSPELQLERFYRRAE